ncbi:prolyl oligopeptidase family serine peptidase [Sphingosinicella terrae]|uniref:prolyl oligopeptidase family serine peptidase n=1 Tax=Sphingosinicella terrae TaxID=2172047 RepID=UPI000E0CC5F2|nr:prolyl oligopeptidase family serine peptidase [Sphingosinicella terrae]
MTPILRLSLLAVLLTSTAALADDRMVEPPADLADAYSHPRMPPSTNTRALAVSRQGDIAAYVVQVPVEDQALDAEMFLPTGAPATIAQGARIMVIDLQTGDSARICPSGGNDWDPAWSPDGRRLAFFSDRDGETRLWLYDRGDRSCRRVSERPAKSLLWAHEEPRWSPDGTRIFFAAWPEAGPGSPAHARVRVAPSTAPEMQPGGVTVYRHDPAAQRRPSTATAAGGEQDFDARCGRGNYLTASLAMAEVDGADARLIVEAEVQGAPGAPNRHHPTPYFRTSASGRWLTYFSAACLAVGEAHRMVTKLFAVSAEGGTPVLIADDLRAAVGGDENILNYRWSPVADELVFTRNGELWRVAFDANGPSAPMRIGASLGPLSPALHWYTQDGSMVLVGTNPVQRGRGNVPFGNDIDLALIPVAGGEPVRIPVDRARWAINGVMARDDRALLQSTQHAFRLLGRDKNTGEAVALEFDLRTGETREAWRGRGRFHDIQAAGNRLVGIYEDFRTPANLFSYARDLSQARALTDIAPQIRAAATSQAETFETVISQHDGTLRTVRTSVLLPPGARRGDRLPAVVWFYPGDDLTTNLDRFGAPGMGDPAYLLTSRGYAVILTNVVIGPGEQRGHVIDEIMDALLPQVYRAADLGYVDINRLAIRGHSFGGFGTLAVVARTNLFRAAIPSAGVYDLGGSYGEADYIRGALVDRSDWSENSQPRLGQPVWDDPLRYIENSPYYLADRIRTPVLILQGTDDFTGSRESGKLFAALRRLNRPVELALYQGGGHTPAFWPIPQAVDQMARTLDFLRRHIGEGWSRTGRADPRQGRSAP